MDLPKIIAELQRERDRLDEAILALERLSAGKLHRRGRPPRWLRDEIDRHPETESPASPAPRAKKAASAEN